MCEASFGGLRHKQVAAFYTLQTLVRRIRGADVILSEGTPVLPILLLSFLSFYCPSYPFTVLPILFSLSCPASLSTHIEHRSPNLAGPC